MIIRKSAISEKYAGGLEQVRMGYAIGISEVNQEDDELFLTGRMNIDKFNIQRLTLKGLSFDESNQYSDDFTIKPCHGPYLWEMTCIADSRVFAWHIDAKQECIDKAIKIGSTPCYEISAMFEKDENPFKTIRAVS